MTSPTQPRDTIQLVLCMPPSLHYAAVGRLGYEMVVRQRDPVAQAEFALGGARSDPYGRWCRYGGCVCIKDGQEKVALVGRVAGGWEEAVALEAVDGVWRYEFEQTGVRGR
jgi:hypothetical protein